jgi:hypothetical protein
MSNLEQSVSGTDQPVGADFSEERKRFLRWLKAFGRVA